MDPTLVEFLESLRTETDLLRLVQESREEDLHLEFKEKTDPETDELSIADRNNFSKSVSGFANAAGGILIFGVVTSDNDDPPDRAVDLRSIREPDRFRARLMDSVANTTQRPVHGVILQTIPADNGRGYVKCLIPASETLPHRAMFGESGGYWRRRSIGTFQRMEHYELEEVFGRRQAPVLRLAITLRRNSENPTLENIIFRFRNDGRGIALHAGFIVHFPGCGIVITSGPRLMNATENNDGRPIVSYYEPHDAIHPNGIYASLGQAIIRRENLGSPLLIEATWYAQDMATRREATELHPDQDHVLQGQASVVNP